MKKIIHSIFIFLLSTTLVLADAAILPNAKTTFLDSNGKPLTSGTVDFYVPGTTTRKTTWQDNGQTTPNANPLTLDAAGRALIWGNGSYRQVVKDKNGNLIWDQVTSSAGTGSSGGSTIGDGLGVGAIVPWAALNAPTNYQFAYGQTLSRVSFPELYQALTISKTIGCVGGSALVNVTDTTSISIGAVLESICAAGSPTVISKTSTTVTLSATASITVTTSGVFYPYGNGDALTTFNLPDLRGYVIAGRCNMGGVDCSNLTSSYFSSNASNTPSGLYAKGGNQSTILLTANLPPYTPAGTVASSMPGGISSFSVSLGAGSNMYTTSGSPTPLAITSIFTGTSAAGQISAPFSRISPTVTLNYVIKVTPDTNLTASFGVAAIGGMTGLISCGTNVTCAGNSISFNFSGVNSIQGMSGNISCGIGLTCSAGSISTTSVNPQVITSRTAAQSLDLSLYTAIKTLGYASGGDGGGATFKKVVVPFLDTSVTSISVTAGTGYTNGTYTNIYFTGGTGFNFVGNITIAGGVVSGVTIANAGGNAYTVNDVLTPIGGNLNIGGTGTGFSITVNTVSTALASFIDLAGNKWQYVTDEGNYINARQFSCKFNWTETVGDAGATDDTACLKAVAAFASYANPNSLQTSIAKTFAYSKIILPAGTSLVSDTITFYGSTVVEGQGPFNSYLKIKDTGLTSGGGAHFIQLCDPNIHAACFGVMLRNLGLIALPAVPANANTFMIFTNNAQQTKIAENIAIYSGIRGCIRYDFGWGGAANANFQDIFCTVATGATASGIDIVNTGTNVITFRNIIVESGGAGFAGNGFNVTTGQVVIDGFHTEGVVTGINVNMAVATHSLVVKNATGGNGCTELVKLQGTNTPGNMSIENSVKNGCTRLVTNGQPSGSNRAADVTPGNTATIGGIPGIPVPIVSFNP